VPLIVDEAHGAHFAPASLNLPRIFPPSALSCGADLVVQSTHKVLTSMTQTAMLHLKGDRVNPDRISAALQVRGGVLDGGQGEGCRRVAGG
jgi:arginine/lysine/ornithine decarboxylase